MVRAASNLTLSGLASATSCCNDFMSFIIICFSWQISRRATKGSLFWVLEDLEGQNLLDSQPFFVFLNPDLTCICYKRGKQTIEPKTSKDYPLRIHHKTFGTIIQGTSENFWEEATMTRCTCFMMFHDVSWCFLFWPCWVNEKLSLGQSGRPCVPPDGHVSDGCILQKLVHFLLVVLQVQPGHETADFANGNKIRPHRFGGEGVLIGGQQQH